MSRISFAPKIEDPDDRKALIAAIRAAIRDPAAPPSVKGAFLALLNYLF